MQVDPEMLFDLPYSMGLARGILGGGDDFEAVGCGIGQRLTGPQEQHPVCPGVVDAAACRPGPTGTRSSGRGSHILKAFQNAADGSIVTTGTPSR